MKHRVYFTFLSACLYVIYTKSFVCINGISTESRSIATSEPHEMMLLLLLMTASVCAVLDDGVRRCAASLSQVG